MWCVIKIGRILTSTKRAHPTLRDNDKGNCISFGLSGVNKKKALAQNFINKTVRNSIVVTFYDLLSSFIYFVNCEDNQHHYVHPHWVFLTNCCWSFFPLLDHFSGSETFCMSISTWKFLFRLNHGHNHTPRHIQIIIDTHCI